MTDSGLLFRWAHRALVHVVEGVPTDRALKKTLREAQLQSHAERKTLSTWFLRTVLLRGRLEYLGDLSSFAIPACTLPTCWLSLYLVLEEGFDVDDVLRLGSLDLDEPLARADVVAEMLARARETPPPWPTDPCARLAVTRSIPPAVAAEWVETMGLTAADARAGAMNEAGPVTLRTNISRISRTDLRSRLEAIGIRAWPTAFSDVGLTLALRSTPANLWGCSPFQQGLFEVQDEGSQLIAAALHARPGEVILDYCAGRGGKTLALAAVLGARGTLVATDVDEASLRDLRVRLRRTGNEWVDVMHLSGMNAPGRSVLPPVGADRVLVDAPCSALGTWRRSPGRRWELTTAGLAAYPALQKQILAEAIPWVKPGGRLVYATCTLRRAENEDIRDWLLSTYPNLRPAALGLPVPQGGSTALTLSPEAHGTDGFFLAAFTA